MSSKKSGGQTLKEAVETHGSLSKANEALLIRKKQLEAEVAEAEKKLSALKKSLQLSAEALEGIHAQIDDKKGEMGALSKKFSDAGKQYGLYEGFIAMMATSKQRTRSKPM